MLGGDTFILLYLFLISPLIDLYFMMLFIDICLYFVFCEVKNLFLFTCIFHTCVYAFYLVFQEIYKLIQLRSEERRVGKECQ